MYRRMIKHLRWYGFMAMVALAFVTVLAIGCRGPAGPPSPAGAPATTPTPTPKPAVSIDAGQDLKVGPGSAVTLKATATINDSSKITGYKWTQVSGVAAKVTGEDTATAMVTLGNSGAYKAKLIGGLETLDRFTVQAINPHALIAAETATFKVTVTTSSGSYTDTVNVNADLPYVVSTGLANVAQGEPVLIGGKSQDAYVWKISGPTGSNSTLTDTDTKNPSFTPDITGKYTLTETKSGATLNVYAGTWAGAITGQDAKGRPLSDACTPCHNGKIAPDQFTSWKESGHAEIFTQNINDPNGHWSLNCASCHGVGYSTSANNGGWDEAITAEVWKAPSHGDVGLWTTMLKDNPKTARLANIQCENCHGPNNSDAHTKGSAARISISSDVCISCHGEPPRHGRGQQWEESGHGNYELAIDDATVETRGALSAHCGRCHTGQGFLAWIAQGDLTKQIQGAKGNATVDELKAMGLTKDTVQPQTCVVCHDPHKQGTTSGEPNTATVRISGDTAMLPAGFQAKNVGNGAICMTCHNTRNGLFNDTATTEIYTGPHEAAQTDVLMGENAYFVSTGQRSPHSELKDTCATCHMEKTPPPAEYSFNGGGTNHAFKASITICSNCHSSTFNGEAIRTGVDNKLSNLGAIIEQYMLNKIPVSVMTKDYTVHEVSGKSYDVASSATAVSKDNIVSIKLTETPLHGQDAFVLKFKNPVTFTYTPTGENPHSLSLLQAEVQLGSVTLPDGKTTVIASTDNLVKACWNYFLIKNDSSKGVHNPTFANEVLDATINALK